MTKLAVIAFMSLLLAVVLLYGAIRTAQRIANHQLQTIHTVVEDDE